MEVAVIKEALILNEHAIKLTVSCIKEGVDLRPITNAGLYILYQSLRMTGKARPPTVNSSAG